MIDLAHELAAALASPETKAQLIGLIREAVRQEIMERDGFVNVEGAAKLLATSKHAIHKAVQRGQLPVVRMGTRLKFRKTDLMSAMGNK